MPQNSLDNLSLDVRRSSTLPEWRDMGHGKLDGLVGSAEVSMPMRTYSIDDLSSIEEPETQQLKEFGWTGLRLTMDVNFYNPAAAVETVRRGSEHLGPVLSVLQQKVGTQQGKLRAAKHIGLKYVSENPGIDISWLPAEITKPKAAFLTLQSESEEDFEEGFSAEVRERTVVVPNPKGSSRREVSHSIGDFFFPDGGHPGHGSDVDLETAVSAEELELLKQLFKRFNQAGHAVVAAAVSDTFSVTPPTANDLWDSKGR